LKRIQKNRAGRMKHGRDKDMWKTEGLRKTWPGRMKHGRDKRIRRMAGLAYHMEG